MIALSKFVTFLHFLSFRRTEIFPVMCSKGTMLLLNMLTILKKDAFVMNYQTRYIHFLILGQGVEEQNYRRNHFRSGWTPISLVERCIIYNNCDIVVWLELPHVPMAVPSKNRDTVGCLTYLLRSEVPQRILAALLIPCLYISRDGYHIEFRHYCFPWASPLMFLWMLRKE